MWLDQFEFAGFYIAKEKGFYSQVGLDVEIKKYTNSTNVLNEVMQKKADFGTSSSSLVVDKTTNQDIILLGTIFQSSPLILLALENSNIKNIKDIKNKTLMITEEQQKFATLQSMLTSKGISLSDTKIIKHSFKIDDLINKKTDLMLAYSTNEPFLLKEKGYKTRIFNPKDYGFDFYEELIFSTKEFVSKNPKLVKDFYEASIKGWEYAFENIDEAVNLIHTKYNPQNKSLKSLYFEANEMKKLVYDKDGKIGTITEEKINLIINTYRVIGLIKNDINLEDLIYTKHLENNIFLNEEEENYLKKKKKITMCVDPDWMPFEKIENNKHVGMAANYIKIIEDKINTPIILVPTKSWTESLEKGKKRDCDIFSLIMTTPEREKYLDFTDPYLKVPLVLAADINSPFIDSLQQIKNQKVAIVKNYAYGEVLKSKYPDIQFVEVNNITEGLKLVEREKVFGFIGTLATVGYNIQRNFVGQLKITGKFDDTWNLSIASRNDEPILNTIFNKALNDISSNQKQEILNKWISINYQKESNNELLNKVLIILIIFISLFILIYRQYLLKKLNKELHEKIEIEMQKNKERNRISIQQSRMASMGEMIENIAHQWRQPLSTISVSASGMQVKKELGILSDEDIYDSINHIKNATQYLSNTIEDFRNFFSRDKLSSNINIRTTINKTFDLISAAFARDEITVVRKIQNITFTSFENEIIQVLMNILINAKDALENKESEKLLIIKVEKIEGNLVISIQDNAGGIKDNIIDKIFEPYFTTKQQLNGTGIGLYMSKLIVEKHLKGEIIVQNIDFEFNSKTYIGALFKVILPLNEEVI